MTHALVRAHVPYRAIAEENLTAATSGLAVLILPSIGALSDAAVLAVRTFVQNGGALIATGDTSRFDAQGNPRADYALADVFGAHLSGPPRDRLFGITSTVNGSTRVAQAWMASGRAICGSRPNTPGGFRGHTSPTSATNAARGIRFSPASTRPTFCRTADRLARLRSILAERSSPRSSRGFRSRQLTKCTCASSTRRFPASSSGRSARAASYSSLR